MVFRKPKYNDNWISEMPQVWHLYKDSDGCDDNVTAPLQDQGWTPCIMPKSVARQHGQKCNLYGTKRCPHGQGMTDLYWDGFNYVIKCCQEAGLIIGHEEGEPETCPKCGVVIDWDGIPVAMPTITPDEDLYDVEEQVIKEIRDRMEDNDGTDI